MIESLKSLLRPPYRLVRGVFFAHRSKKIARAYARHYREAQALFRSSGQTAKPLSEIIVNLVPAMNGGSSLMALPPSYPDLVERIRTDADKKFGQVSNCLFFPPLREKAPVEKTADLSEIRNGQLITMQMKQYLGIDGVEELCSLLSPEIESRIFGSPVVFEKLYFYRSLVSTLEGQVSWLWHYDNHPGEIRKLMIYLTDVNEETGPLEYLRSKETGEPLLMTPAPLMGYSRVPDRALKHYLANGYESCKITGPRGTMILFSENIIHRANVAKSGLRDVMVLQMRPSTFKPERALDPRWTGSFEHEDISPDPWNYSPKPKHRMLSA